MTIGQLYEQVKSLPAPDQLQLATLMLTGTAPLPVLEDSGDWSEGEEHAQAI